MTALALVAAVIFSHHFQWCNNQCHIVSLVKTVHSRFPPLRKNLQTLLQQKQTRQLLHEPGLFISSQRPRATDRDLSLAFCSIIPHLLKTSCQFSNCIHLKSLEQLSAYRPSRWDATCIQQCVICSINYNVCVFKLNFKLFIYAYEIFEKDLLSFATVNIILVYCQTQSLTNSYPKKGCCQIHCPKVFGLLNITFYNSFITLSQCLSVVRAELNNG